MSHATHAVTYAAQKPSDVTISPIESSTAQELEKSAMIYMIVWMTAGTIFGAWVGYSEFTRAQGSFLPALAMISAVTGSVVGAAIGQLVGGCFHIIASKALD